MGSLDDKFIGMLTSDKVKTQFEDLVKNKTDIYDGGTYIARGCDGIDHVRFFENLDKHALIICEKGLSGKYCFAPFREVEVPKPPYGRNELETAKKVDKIRTLSISTIQDTIFQNLIADVVCAFAETVFAENIDLHSYGYRKRKSSKMAVSRIRRFVDEGYLHILDGDIKHFFDEIDHVLLMKKVCEFFGDDNPLIQTFIRRFIHVDRIPSGQWYDYRQGRIRPAKRLIGIPQGGVLSGLLANIFLYDFDLYVVNSLMPQYGFRYFRYADDFVLMFKKESHIHEVYKLIHDYLSQLKLTLHPIGEKTKVIDMSSDKKQNLDFLGFEISPKYLRIKYDNLIKFKNRVSAELSKIEKIDDLDNYFNEVIMRINSKIVGLENLIAQENGLCPVCKKLIPKRSWIGYFSMSTDVRMLKDIDTMIRTAIYKDYCIRTNKHIRKRDLLRYTGGRLKSVEKTYYLYKKQLRKYGKHGCCKCERVFDKESWQFVVKESGSKPQ